jgi:hypothetical protein
VTGLVIVVLVLVLSVEIMGPRLAQWLVEQRISGCFDAAAVQLDPGRRPFIGQIASATFRDVSITGEGLDLSLLPTVGVGFTAARVDVSRSVLFGREGDVTITEGTALIEVSDTDLSEYLEGATAGVIQVALEDGYLDIGGPLGIIGIELSDAMLTGLMSSGVTAITDTYLGDRLTAAVAEELSALVPEGLEVVDVAVTGDSLQITATVSGDVTVSPGGDLCP